ncbi:MAG: DUF929 family protein [Thermoplasmataceae archaeon]|jgi:hypothetical protein
MSNNKNKKKPEPVKPNSNVLPKIMVIVIGAVLIVTVLYFAGYLPLPHFNSSNTGQSNFTAPTSIPWGSFTEISNKNFAGSGQENIYFISWVGCPIGASVSWSLNYALSQNVNNTYATPHYSDPTEGKLASLPGLLFSDSFTFKHNGEKVLFDPVYMYNETLFGYANNNTPIESSNLVSAGLSVVNSSSPSIPTGILNLIYKYTNVVKINNMPKNVPSAYLGDPPHMNTVLVITGAFGTYMLNGQIYDPLNIKGIQYQDLINAESNGYASYSYIAQGANTILSIINK